MVRPWRSRRRPSGAPSAAGRRRSGSAGAASARPGARSRRRRCRGWSGPGSGRPATAAARAAPDGSAAGRCRPRRCRSGRSTRPTPRPGRPASTSSTGCSAAAWSPARCCCSRASPGSASPRCCSRRAHWSRRPARCSTSPARSPPPRCGCARTGSAPCTRTCTWPPRPTWTRSSRTCPPCEPRLLIIDSVQTIAAGDVDGVPGGVTQVREVAAALTAVAKEQGDVDHPGRPRHQGRLGGRARAPWSTWSTWCCTSRATGTRGCGWSARSRTGTGRPTRSAASTSASTA